MQIKAFLKSVVLVGCSLFALNALAEAPLEIDGAKTVSLTEAKDLYENGAAVAISEEDTTFVANDSAPFTIGCRSNFDFLWNGQVGGVAVYDRALTPTEIQSHANYTTPPPAVDLPIPTLPNGVPTFDIPNTVSGKTYTLEYKNDLAAAAWTSLTGAGVGTGHGGTLVLKDESAPLPAARFYRLEVK